VHTILIGALLGMALVAWRPSARVGRVLAWSAIAPAAVVTVAFTQWSGTEPWYYEGGSLLFAVLVAAVIAGVVRAGPLTWILSRRPLVWIGRISYGLYLWHWPVTVWIVPSRVDVSNDTLNLLRLAVTFAFATVSYYLVERPIRERRWRSPVRASAWFVPAVGVVVAALVFSASNAKPPPSFAWDWGDPLPCQEPLPEERQEAIAAAAAGAPLDLAGDAQDHRLLLVGDSTACSLWSGLRAVGEHAGIATDRGAVYGCGAASGEITTTRNEPIPPNSQRCAQMTDDVQREALARARPTVVLWMSMWEKSDLVVGGETLVAGTPEAEDEIMGRMDAALARLTAGGARVVMLTQPAPAPYDASTMGGINKEAEDEGFARLEALIERFAARHQDDVTVVDLAGLVCPTGAPCPGTVDGMTIRPDGHHFSATSATWAARWLLTQIFPSAA
jgi:hypothetical protein